MSSFPIVKLKMGAEACVEAEALDCMSRCLCRTGLSDDFLASKRRWLGGLSTVAQDGSLSFFDSITMSVIEQLDDCICTIAAAQQSKCSCPSGKCSPVSGST